MSTATISPELMQKLLTPELKAQLAAGLDAQIKELEEQRKALMGGSRRGPKAGSKPAGSNADTSGNKLKHKEAVLKVLGYVEFKSGATSKQIKEAAKEKLDHEFGISLATTLNKMSVAKEIKNKRIEKNKRHYTYTAA